MKLALPKGKDCQYIRRKLKLFYNANVSNPYMPSNEQKEFNRAFARMFAFFQLPIPKVEWFKNLGRIGNKVLGQCTHEGVINLLTPYYHSSSFEDWLDTVYHEVGHYVLWYDCEKKAREFANKMRWKG